MCCSEMSSEGGIVGMMGRQWAGQPKSHGLIPSRRDFPLSRVPRPAMEAHPA
jgi:hypothetical protein